MDSAHDPLRPQELASFHVLALSQSTWRALLSSARSSVHLPYRCSKIKSLLNQTPSIPESAEVIESISNNSIFLEGHATWTVSSPNTTLNDNCDLPPTKKTSSRRVYIGESGPGVCSLSNDYFSDWPGLQPLKIPAGNLLAVFVLGWSYILSARLIELRRTTSGDKVIYTNDMAQWNLTHDPNTGDYFELDIGCDSAAEVRWWAAILAGGRGWHATLARGSEAYYSPWECHLDRDAFRICHSAKLPSSLPTLEPPSSAIAQEYIYSLARHHDAFDQLICALAATMTLPRHNRFGAAIVLPRPVKRDGPRQQTEIIFADQIPTFDEIPRYMAFSGTSGLLTSCLFGGLFEPGVPCNLASQWLDPALKEIAPLLFQTKQSFPVVWALSERRPNLASLWLGATITGLLPRIFQVSASFLPTIYLEGVSWTQSAQSFVDPANHRLVVTHRNGEKVMISREDEFRLLFLTDTLSESYGVPPLCPYPPIGEVDVRHTSLQVRLHLSCDHRLVYRSWEWQCQKGETINDSGTPTKVSKPISLLSIWIVTGIACRSLFKNTLWVSSLPHTQYSSVILLGSLATTCVLPRGFKPATYKHFLYLRAWASKTISIFVFKIRPTARRLKEEEALSERISRIATRNLFSWTLFTEGIRTDEKPLWKHDWLETLIERDLCVESSESSSSGTEGEAKHQKFEYIERWQEDISVHATSDCDCQSSQQEGLHRAAEVN